MAFAAFRELGVDAGCVRCAVAITALRNDFVFAGVTLNTGDIVMLGLAGLQLRKRGVVTCGTHDVLSGCRVFETRRGVSRVACRAVVLGHVVGVGFMTLGTGRDIAVGVRVTEVTGDFGMGTGGRNELSVLVGVAGQALGFQFALEDNIQRLVRIVACQTVCEREVITSLMALGAGRNIVLADRAVAAVAIDTVDFFFVGRAGCGDLIGFLLVTFAAIVNGEFGRQRTCCEKNKGTQQQSRKESLDGKVSVHDSS